MIFYSGKEASLDIQHILYICVKYLIYSLYLKVFFFLDGPFNIFFIINYNKHVLKNQKRIHMKMNSFSLFEIHKKYPLANYMNLLF